MVRAGARDHLQVTKPPRRRAFVPSVEVSSYATQHECEPRGEAPSGSYPTPVLKHMDLLTWIIVGLIAGMIASAVVGGVGAGLLGDMVIGMVGALVGGWIFGKLRIETPIGGVAGNILVAFVGAVVLLVLFRVLKPGRLFA